MFDLLFLALECTPAVAPQTIAALVHVESAYNPYVTGVVGGRVKQPGNLEGAVRTETLHATGNFCRGFMPNAPSQKSYVEKVLATTDVDPIVSPLTAPALPTGTRLNTEPPKPQAAQTAPVMLRAERDAPLKPPESVQEDAPRRNPKVVF